MRLLEHLSVTASPRLRGTHRRAPASGLDTTDPSDGANRRRSNLLAGADSRHPRAARARSAHHPGALAGRPHPCRPHRAHYYCGGTLLAGVPEGLAAVPEDLVDAARAQGPHRMADS